MITHSHDMRASAVLCVCTSYGVTNDSGDIWAAFMYIVGGCMRDIKENIFTHNVP